MLIVVKVLLWYNKCFFKDQVYFRRQTIIKYMFLMKQVDSNIG